ncbi:MAG TPA: NAD(P)-binding domain-containing protein [Candidatus Cybelea sp.]|nr:NAD(P)-binding domain-containing protein [Candidatus Cybelea sp.]
MSVAHAERHERETEPAPRAGRAQPRIGIIGAGPSGIAAAKSLRAAGFKDIVLFERNREVGGNWIFNPKPSHSSVFETTHIISSKSLSQYEDFPMPADYPDYPGHEHLRRYFQDYARHFGVEPLIRFGTEVKRVEPAGGTWRVVLDGGETQTFDRLLIANGHHWNPRMPSYPGAFAGEMLHSHDFKSAKQFAGKRVLVIGGGNSACDIAVETSRVAGRTCISMRRGYWFVPKFMMGLPTDVLHQKLMLKFPKPIRQTMMRMTLKLTQGSNRLYGLQEPEHGPLEAHPTLNSELLYFIRHGEIHPKPDIKRFDGHTVHFADGTAEEFDAIIAATGFVTTFPFLDRAIADYSGNEVRLYLKIFHPRHENLYFIGLFQPLGCIWPLADYQGRLVAKHIAGQWGRPSNIDAAIDREMAHPDYAWTKSVRHAVEVDYHAYRARLIKELGGRHAF